MRLGLVGSTETSNARYRAILHLRELERRGHTVLWPGHSCYELLEQGGVPKLDLLHVQQLFGEEVLGTIELLSRHGIAVVWDTDDDVSALPKSSDAYKSLGGRRKIRRHFERTVAIARAAHLMTTTSEHLARIYREAGVEHVTTIENFIAPEDLNGRRPRHQGIVIGLVAAGEHEDDLRKMRIGQILHDVLRAHDGVRVVSIGADLKIPDHRYRHVRLVPIERLIAAEREFDIGVAPLLDTPFNRSRSNVKLKEYAAAGAMWLASPVGPYVGMGEEQGGLLVREGEWYDALSAIVQDGERRRELAGRARAWAGRQTARRGADLWQAAYRTALLRARRA
jgi:glycosyltransferase involved in cell wall biosynthesis